MAEPRILRFYLDDDLRRSVMDGQHNFINKIATVVQSAGYRVEYRQNTAAERAKSAHRRGYSMFHMDDPFHDRALMIRRAYYYPFWAIEPDAKRWNWRVATSEFDANETDRKTADRFYSFWQERLFGDLPAKATKQGYVYVPLQGKLTKHRSFQACSPIEMIEQVLDQDSRRKVIAALHPKENYSKAELNALDKLVRTDPRLSVRTGDMENLLARCDYVVTQNSSAAFAGYFFGKPAVLFARIDFHHIAANVHDIGPKAALAAGPDLTPDYSGYIHWFWQIMSINAGRPDAADRIRDALLRANWPT